MADRSVILTPETFKPIQQEIEAFLEGEKADATKHLPNASVVGKNIKILEDYRGVRVQAGLENSRGIRYVAGLRVRLYEALDRYGTLQPTRLSA